MIRTGIVGLGKMGVSHCAILNALAETDVVAVCDSSRLALAVLERYTGVSCFTNHRRMLDKSDLDAVVIATPPSSHAEIVADALERGVHVFVEKPFCLDVDEGRRLIELAESRELVNQVGYHLRFCGTFREAKRLLASGAIGEPYHFTAECYGCVFAHATGKTWRAKRAEGGGCLYDYASHAVDLVNYLLGPPSSVAGTVMKSIMSSNSEDAVYSTLRHDSGLAGQLAVNWCDPTYRRMTIRITVLGTLGKLVTDRQECALYVEGEGWTVRYTTELTPPVDFYLRGEEYTAQLDHFVEAAREGRPTSSTFASAHQSDVVADLLARDARGGG